MDTTDRDLALKYDYGLVRKAILSNWSPKHYLEQSNDFTTYFSLQINELWEELKIVEQSYAWNSISYLSFLITESFLREFFYQKSGNSNFLTAQLGNMVSYAKSKLDLIYTNTKNKIPELSSTIDGLRKWRNRVIHHGIPFSDSFELRATQALLLMVRVISDVFSPPLRKFSDESRPNDPNWWITHWRELPPVFVITRLKKNSTNFDKLKEVVSNPDLFFDHMLAYVSASRILDLSIIARKFGIESTKLSTAIERNFHHLIIGSGKSSIENSIRTIEALRKMRLSVFAESFSILIPLNGELVRKALEDIDKIGIIFFLREIFRDEHKIFFETETLKNLIVEACCMRFKIGSSQFSVENNKVFKKILEALPHEIRREVRDRIKAECHYDLK